MNQQPRDRQNIATMPSIVFIDNDELMRFTWIFAAQIKDINLFTYPHPNEFIKEIARFDKNTLIYIDSDLGEKVSGETYAQEIHKQGFNEIYLCTGHLVEDCSNMPWIKAVVGKTPSF